jgi:hypothetical protein
VSRDAEEADLHVECAGAAANNASLQYAVAQNLVAPVVLPTVASLAVTPLTVAGVGRRWLR